MNKSQRGATSALILNEDKHILFVKRSDTDDFLPGYWEFPGGGIDYGETAEKAVIREIKEECGIEIKVIKPIAIGDYFYNEDQVIEICYLCKAESLEIELSSEHSEFKWLKFEDTEGLKISDYMRKMIKSIQANLK